jgi:xanthine dehydrogenase YagT iron-sulfur-binding subunit
MERHLITLKANGETYTIEIESRETLLRLLRERLDLTGAKEGCGHGECGVCIVLVNGKTMKGCLIPAVAVQDRVIFND